MQPPMIVNEDGWVYAGDLSENVILYRRIDSEEATYVYEALKGVQVVAVVDVKGGVKKTTSAVHIAHGLHRYKDAKKTVLIGDCDQYSSVTDWQQLAESQNDPWPEGISVVTSSGDNFHHDLIAEVRRIKPDYLVIDTPPNDEDAALRALLGADVMLTPTGPFPMDIRRLSYGLQVGAEVVSLRGGTIKPLAMLTGVKMGTAVFRTARQHLDRQGMDYLNMPIRDFIKHAEAFGTSLPDLNDYDFVPKELVPMLDRIHEAR